MPALLGSWGAKRCWWTVPAAYVGAAPILATIGHGDGWCACSCSCRCYGVVLMMFLIGLLVLIPLGRLAWGAAREGVPLATFAGFALMPSAGGTLLGGGVAVGANAHGAAMLTPALAIVLAVFGVVCALAWLSGEASLNPRFDGETCPSCRYDLRGLPEPRCPECGWEPAPEYAGAPATGGDDGVDQRGGVQAEGRDGGGASGGDP